MSYWNPIEQFGTEKFAATMSANGGVGVITPDLTPEEAAQWISDTDARGIDRVFLVALSSTQERIGVVAQATTGFVYAGAVMGVTGVKEAVSDSVKALVEKTRNATSLPIAVGLGVNSAKQVKDIAQYADGVIVGSAFVKAINEGGADAARKLAQELAAGLGR